MTADHEQQLGHGPDQRPQTQQLPLADRLVFTYQSRLDLSSASELVMSNIGSEYSGEALAVIADVKQQAGISLLPSDQPNPELVDEFNVIIGKSKPKWMREKEAAISKGPRNHAVRYDLAFDYATLGYWQDAESIIYKVNPKSRSLNPGAIPWVLAYIAVGQAKDSVDPSEKVREVENRLEQIGVQTQFGVREHAEILCLLAQANANFNLDPQPLIEKAFRMAELERSNGRIHVYLKIAEVQMNHNQDPKNALGLAFEWNKVMEKRFGTDIMAQTCQIIDWTDIVSSQLRAGLLDDARKSIAEIDKYTKDEPDFILMQAEMLAELARQEAQLGLSREEIDRLSPADLHSVLTSGNHLAEEALEYFGISKTHNS